MLLVYEEYGGEKIGGLRSPKGFNVFYKSNMNPLGQIYKEADGFYVFSFQPSPSGCWDGGVLKELGLFIEEQNKEWQETLINELTSK